MYEIGNIFEDISGQWYAELLKDGIIYSYIWSNTLKGLGIKLYCDTYLSKEKDIFFSINFAWDMFVERGVKMS